jgi:putative aldouronate transport system substrate-binding protein
MFKRQKNYLALLVVLVLVICPLIGAAKTFRYPMKTNVTLKYWMEMHTNLAAIYKNFGDSILAKELEKRTGVKCEYIHPAGIGDPSGEQTKEAFNLMLASGDLPDIVEYKWQNIPGGPNAAINNGFILRLNKVYDRYAPNLKRWLKKNPNWAKQTRTDEGDYYVFPFVRAHDRLLVTSGPIIRKDWLDELKLPMPVTPDEIYTVLKAFKEKKGATAPLTMTLDRLRTDIGAGFDFCGDQDGFYVDKGRIQYGLNTHQYKNFLIAMNKWFAEGLLDNNFANLTTKTRDANILNGKTGIVHGSAGGQIGVWMTTMETKNPQFEVVGMKYASPKRGQPGRFALRALGYGGLNGGNAAISARCKAVKSAARMLDYNYSKAGNLLINFGIEGVSYKMVKGYPTYTEAVANDPKQSFARAVAKYIRGHMNGPFVQDVRYIEQYYNKPQQVAAQKNWMANNYVKYFMPPLTPNDQESMQLAQIMNDINTYSDEMSMRFIMGMEPLGKYDAYVSQLDKMGLDKALKTYQAAYLRYKKR